jgi:hypothetical protein
MDRKLVGGVVTAAGVALLVLSALADPIGLGEGGGFGWKQTTGVIVGAVVVVVGLALMYVRRGEAKAPQPQA